MLSMFRAAIVVLFALLAETTCGTHAVAPSGLPSSTGPVSTSTSTGGPASASGVGLNVQLHSCAPALTSTPPPCDAVEVNAVLSMLHASTSQLESVRQCWGNPPVNYEDIEARDFVVGPLSMSTTSAIHILKTDREVTTVTTISLPYVNATCNAV